ncbi:MAG: hypothetical protein WB998_06090 [Solirubrobacteraceae bacterium]
MPVEGVVAKNVPPATDAPAQAGAVAEWGVLGAASCTAPTSPTGTAMAIPTVVSLRSHDIPV